MSLEPVNNAPITYDFHGDIPFSIPFKNIRPEDIDIYLDVDTYIGKKTCGQACDHCWFVQYEKVFQRSFSFEEGEAICRSLIRKGFGVFPRFTDSFAYDGELMKRFGVAKARTYMQEESANPAKTMEYGEAWTSGKPLLGDNANELLQLALDQGYRTITITFHGLLNDDLSLQPSKQYPIKGVLTGQDFEKVYSVIKAFNQDQEPENCFRIGVGITLGRHNYSRNDLVKYAKYFNRLDIAVLRFNSFTDHGRTRPELPLNSSETKQLYKDLSWLHKHQTLNFQLGISEDIGTEGIKELGLPSHVGWCRAGRQLFAIMPTPYKSDHSNEANKQVVGILVGCVNIFEPELGKLYKLTNDADDDIEYVLEFDEEKIEQFNKDRFNGRYNNGCFAKEILQESPPVLVRDMRKSKRASELA